MNSYTTGYLQACHDIKVLINNRFATQNIFGQMSVPVREINASIDHFAKMERRNA